MRFLGRLLALAGAAAFLRRFAGLRFAAFLRAGLRFAALRFAGLRFAALRFAGLRFAAFFAGLRFAASRFAGLRFQPYASRACVPPSSRPPYDLSAAFFLGIWFTSLHRSDDLLGDTTTRVHTHKNEVK